MSHVLATESPGPVATSNVPVGGRGWIYDVAVRRLRMLVIQLIQMTRNAGRSTTSVVGEQVWSRRRLVFAGADPNGVVALAAVAAGSAAVSRKDRG